MLEKKQTWSETILIYKDIRMLRILLLGAISGFPWVLIGSSLTLWLNEEQLEIMLERLVQTPWTMACL